MNIMKVCMAVLLAAGSISACTKDDPEQETSPYPCFVYADNLSKPMPDAIEVKLSDRAYPSRCSFVPFDGKTKLKYDGDNPNSFKYTLSPEGSVYWGAFYADSFNMTGWAFGFAAGTSAKVGDKVTATLDYSYNGATIHKVVTVTVVE